MQDTAVFNTQNPTDIGGIPWAWLREEKWRLHTFAKYPLSANKSAILLAEAGFAYIGSGNNSEDTVICFFCHGVKQGWQENENICDTHRALSPNCAMVLGTGGGNIPLIAPDNVSFGRIHSAADHYAIETDCPQASRQAGQADVTAQQLNTPQHPSNKPKSPVQLATHTVMSLPPTRPSGGQSQAVVNSAGLRQACDERGNHSIVTSSNTVPSLQRAGNAANQSQGSPQSAPTSSLQTQRQGTASSSGHANSRVPRMASNSGRNVPDGGGRSAQDNPVPASTTEPAVQSARLTSSQFSAPATSSSSPATSPRQPSAPTTATQSSAPTSATQSSAPTSATQSSAPTSASQSSAPRTNMPSSTATQAPPTTTASQPSTTTASQPSTTTSSTNQPSTPATNPPAVPQNPTYLELGIITERPKRYEYAVRFKRLDTFGDWPADHHLRKEDLADAGFYYAGYGDCARCFYCGGGLRNWEQDDDVWVEHARWFPKCAFIRQRLGQVFIDTVALLAQTNDKISFNDVVAKMKIDPSAFQIDSKETPLKNDAAVLAVRQMGYTEGDILPVAATLKESGQILSADILYTALEEKGIRRALVNLNTRANNLSVSVNRDKAKDEELLNTLKQTNNDLRLQTLCKICMDREVAVVFLPCGHLVCCTECASAMKDCPVCRNQVKGIVRAFMG
ncbi:baculoviral IAP repeat-containing protein 7 [Elysia marginata]|uniref:Baculoviral IAP repeat-containing protein 7 n=1 Tax=Elysia marginata TaxID=1093978 RepID=A0AAV4GXR4_9GAST|nr:baculoviral IAP repeat-containing protein 7 [Elysia marginata]